MNKILMIAYHFYPDLAIGAQRTNKYAKYLPQFGWQPHILSVKPGYYDQLDQSSPELDCPVYRCGRWPVPSELYMSLKQLLKSGSRTGDAKGSASRAPSAQAAAASCSWLQKLVYTVSATPDGFIGWYIPAVRLALRVIRENKIDVVYTSGPPQTNHLIGYTLSRLTGRPLVLDFRDPWLYKKRHHDLGLAISKKFDERYEGKAIRQASLVVTTTDEWRDALKARYRPWLGDRCQTIVNGFDEEDFPVESVNVKKDKGQEIIFLHAGTLYAGRDPYDLLIALGELLAEGFCRPDEIRFEFFGSTEIDMDKTKRIIADYKLTEVVSFSEPVERSRYLRLLSGADALIMFQSDLARVHIPAKAFEYLGTGNEILCLTSEGATKNFMSAFEQVAIAPLDDKNLIKEAIRKIVMRLKSDSADTGRVTDLKQITRRYLAGRFAGLLDKLVDSGV